MSLRSFQLLPALLAPLLACGPASSYEASRGPTEVVYWDPDKAYGGYTVVSPSRVDGVYLIDMSGEVVKYWPELTGLYLAEDGTLVGSKRGADFVEVDWDGNVLWEYSEPRESYHPHHDDLRIYNAALGEHTRLYIANVDMSHDEVIALGADPTRAERYDGVQMDAIVEVDREGNVVWEYVSPVTAADGIVITSMHTNILGGWSPFRYAPHHPGLAGKDLSPKGPITEFHAGTD